MEQISVQYRLAQLRDYQPIMNFLKYAFPTLPYNRFNNVIQTYLEYFKPLVANICQNGLGYLAINKLNQTIIGAVLLTINSPKTGQEPPEQRLSMTEVLQKIYKEGATVLQRQYGLSLHTIQLYLLITDQRYRNIGLASNLVKHAEQYGKNHGYNHMISIAVNFYTGRIYNKQKWNKIYEINASEFLKAQGFQQYDKLEEIHRSNALWMKKLNE